MSKRSSHWSVQLTGIAAAAILTTGCATREVPQGFPPDSPLSRHATIAPTAMVTDALAPETPPPAETPHEHHHHPGGRHVH